MKFSIWLTRRLFACRVMYRRKDIRDYKRGETPRSRNGIGMALLIYGRMPTNAEIERAIFGNHLDVHTRKAI